jgi:hypothetical protein
LGKVQSTPLRENMVLSRDGGTTHGIRLAKAERWIA